MNHAAASQEELSGRLQKVAAELRSLDDGIKSGKVDARVLREFREALDHLRLTAWSVQQWIELEAQQRDPYTVLSLLTRERIRRTAQLCDNLSIDLDAMEVTYESEGLDKLFAAVEALFTRLARMFKRKG